MPKRCNITVHWLNGDVTEFQDCGLHADEKQLRIYPAADRGKTIIIPLVCIYHYITEG